MGDNTDVRQHFTIEELGITSEIDDQGQVKLIIPLPPNERFGSAETRVIFDPKTRKWTLAPTTRTTWAHGEELTTWAAPLGRADLSPAARPVEWTRGLPHTDHVNMFLYTIDWSATSMGPLETWPLTLQVYLNMLFSDAQCAIIYWGENLNVIYNQRYTSLALDRIKKPGDMMGAPFRKMWPEISEDFKPMMQGIAERGIGSETVEVVLYPSTNGYPQETFYNGNFQPIRDFEGVTQGFYNSARDITQSVLGARRAKLLGSIAAKPHIAGDYVFQHIVNALGTNDRDFPMSFIYSAFEDVTKGTCQLKLHGGRGLPASGHPLVPDEFDLHDGHAGFAPLFRRAKGLAAPLVLQLSDGTLDPDLIQNFEWTGFDEPSRALAILPLSTSDRLLSVLVVGLNSRRPIDSEFDDFLKILLRQCSATVSAAIDHEEARLRAERLSKRLEDSEKQIREIAEFGPVGIARIAPAGKLIWANDQFYSITGHGRAEEDRYDMSFLDLFHSEDRPVSESLWTRLLQSRESVSAPLRLRRTWRPPPSLNSREDEDQPVWLLTSAYPIMEGKGLKAAAIAVTDISRFKWAEAVQSRIAAAAKEAKRLQENFIDVISHEMRNPLSAITQLADGISMAEDDFQKAPQTLETAQDIIVSNVESAKTILLCAAHQKRIIDDVLTLSKLDSMMLSITPVAVQPYAIVESVLKMFDAEFAAHGISVRRTKHQSFVDCKIDWVRLDPSRLTQIFINLITNAIKFTKTEREKTISIRVGASTQRPPLISNVKWFPTNKKYVDLTLDPKWGSGEPVYVLFEVQDTGRGMEQHEMTKLFGRFQQATEKTHIKYGGSGLGLFISRELTETQGGEIGVQSERGKGTTFAFYVKARRAERPPNVTRRSHSNIISETADNHKLPIHHLPPDPTPRQDQDVQMSNGIPEHSRKIQVLLVEDNVVNAKVLTKQLQREACEVYGANHGAEALDVLRKTRAWRDPDTSPDLPPVDVILMDIEMPVMDGLTCTRRIRQLEREGVLNRQIIVAITANARQEQIDTVLEAGADDVLPKPFRVKECLEKIKNIVGARNGLTTDSAST